MESYRAERPEQLYVEVGRWSLSVKSIAVTVAFILVVAMLANSVRTNNDRASDWQRRAIAAEEIVGGLRVVLADRSRALNQRTRQANLMVSSLDSSRGKLLASRSSVGALERRQQQLASEKARAEAARTELQKERAALRSVASALNTCSQNLTAIVGKTQKATAADRQARLEQCGRAQARFDAVVE